MSITAALHQFREIDSMYAAALQDYLKLGDENCLHRGYELGRRAVQEGRSILQMIELHQNVVSQVLAAPRASKETVGIVEAATLFLREAMSSYEMTNRIFKEANSALEHVNDILESEVRRLAYKLHDGVGQLLAAAHIQLEDIGHALPAGIRERLQEVRGIMDQVETELRASAHELHPPLLEAEGLIPALRSLAIVVTRRTSLRVIVESRQHLALPFKTEIVLYRVVQEALKNAAKHARAQSARVSLRLSDSCVYCSITDNGIGFDKDSLPAGHGLGLRCIRERVQALHGSFQIESAPQRGTKVSVLVPRERRYGDNRIAG